MEEKKKYLLKGDISGIQEFIFNVQSKGAAKALHENSVNIMKLEDKHVKELATELEIRNPNIYKGGGGFHFVLENVDGDEIEQSLNKFQLKLNKELKQSPVSIRLALGNGNSFGEAWQSLHQCNNRKRYHPYEGISKEDYETLFEPFEKREKYFEDFFPNEKDLVLSVENKRWSKELLQICRNNTVLNDEQEKLIGKIDILSDDEKPFIDFDGYASFAKARTGTDLLGVLKMDVDNLGELFGGCNTETEFSGLSTFLNDFFGKDHIKLLLSRSMSGKHERNWTYHENIYTVFTGGDDCFFIGAWDTIMDFAQIIQVEFKKQVKHQFRDKNITLSAGIVLLDSKTPVVQLGKMAEEALSKAKSRRIKSEIVKNAVCIMNEIFTWDDYEDILKQSDTLVTFLNEETISRGLLEKIKKSSKGFDAIQRRIKKGEKLPFDSVYKLKYYLHDVKKKDVEEVEKEIFKPYIDALTKALMLTIDNVYSDNYVNPMRFPLAARIAEFKTKILKK